jgi:diacylglycerol kinase (ATP)
MKIDSPHIRPKPERVTGIHDVFAAAVYSVGGARRLWKAAAFRHIVLVFILCLALLASIGASGAQFGVFLILFLALVAVEALNIAIECIVDHLAPNWHEFARGAKNLWSSGHHLHACRERSVPGNGSSSTF